MNWIWIAVGILLAFAVYYKLFINKKLLCKITVFEKNGDILVKHKKEYKGIMKVVENESGTKQVRWLHIPKLKKDWIIPANKFYIPSNNGGIKHLCLAWYGGNNFQPIKPSIRTYDYIPIRTSTGKIVYKRAKRKDTTDLEIIPEDVKYTVCMLDDTLERVYQKDKSLLEKLQPYYFLGVCVIAALMIIYLTGKIVNESAATNEDTASWIAKAIEGVSSEKVDDRTTIEKDITQGGGT